MIAAPILVPWCVKFYFAQRVQDLWSKIDDPLEDRVVVFFHTELELCAGDMAACYYVFLLEKLKTERLN